MTDPLAQIVEVLAPVAPLSKVVSGSGPWRVDRFERGDPFYCVVLEGGARLSVHDRPSIVLEEGDFVLIPAAFAFSTTSVAEPHPSDETQWAITMLEGETRHGDPHGPADVRMLIGHFVFGSPDREPLVSLLPQLLHIRGERRLSMLVRLITEEARTGRPAREMILARLLEVLLVEALRSATAEAAPQGIMRALTDPRLALAIRRLHQDPARPWTVEQMAEEAALSRSAFFNRFRQKLGVTPMEYLTSWRMALAKNLLRSRQAGLQEIAEQIGYGSASAFSTAFTRLVGIPPSRYAEQAAAIGQPLVAA
ncbi:AraC-like DNA-binding protein [Pseudorhizobium tarimense]|uniref:AraC-like DNA-binding protein n=1 Tax=Pseudorhizobium tarimense TaxID=1079109 RepID=A0ABV2HAG7_9HYPH|nr:AraC family transcriptional regulator [Pseudorhizobium tarimense]MCJ8520576.1 AraC family transcriptional regulator [Pseudorhizobium tarimense]